MSFSYVYSQFRNDKQCISVEIRALKLDEIQEENGANFLCLRENNITTFLIVPPENRRKPFLFNNLNVFNTAGPASFAFIRGGRGVGPNYQEEWKRKWPAQT